MSFPRESRKYLGDGPLNHLSMKKLLNGTDGRTEYSPKRKKAGQVSGEKSYDPSWKRLNLRDLARILQYSLAATSGLSLHVS